MPKNDLRTVHADVSVCTLVLYIKVRYQVAQPQTLLAPPVATAALAPMYGPESVSSGQPRRQLAPPHGLPPMPPPPNNNGSPFEQKIQIGNGTSSEVHPLNGVGGKDGTGGGGGGGYNAGQEGSASSSASPRADPHDGQDRKNQRQL